MGLLTLIDSGTRDIRRAVDGARNDFPGTGAVLIPVPGSTAGLNGTFFKTDVWITNTATTPGGGDLRFYPAAGSDGTIQGRRVALAGGQTSVLADVTNGFLNIPGRSLSYLILTPVTETNAAISAGSLSYDETQSTFSVRKVGEQTFNIGPNEAIFLRGVSTQLIGTTRATFGDLRNLQLRVEVLSGQGSVVAFTSMVDNGTGDATVRFE